MCAESFLLLESYQLNVHIFLGTVNGNNMCWAAGDLVRSANQEWAGACLVLQLNINAPRLLSVFWLSLLCKVWICCLHQMQHRQDHLQQTEHSKGNGMVGGGGYKKVMTVTVWLEDMFHPVKLIDKWECRLKVHTADEPHAQTHTHTIDQHESINQEVSHQ